LNENDYQQNWLQNEYQSLMQEVLHNRGKQSQAFIYGLITTGALFGFAATFQDTIPSSTFLLPIIILLPLALIIIFLRNAIDRIEAYIRVRFTASGVNLSYLVNIRRFRWPLGIVSYIPIFKLMVYTNLCLSLVCVGTTLYLASLSRQQIDIATITLCSVAFFAIVAVAVFLAISDLTCKPERLEKAWRDLLQLD